MSTTVDPVIFYGYTPVPRDPEVLFADHPTASGPNPKQDVLQFKDVALPDSKLVQEVKAFVKVIAQTPFFWDNRKTEHSV